MAAVPAIERLSIGGIDLHEHDVPDGSNSQAASSYFVQVVLQLTKCPAPVLAVELFLLPSDLQRSSFEQEAMQIVPLPYLRHAGACSTTGAYIS